MRYPPVICGTAASPAFTAWLPLCRPQRRRCPPVRCSLDMSPGTYCVASLVQAPSAPDASYGMVLALQMTMPKAMLTLVQCLSADYPDHPKDLFQLQLTNVQSSLAVENGQQDVRCASCRGLATCGGSHAVTQQTAKR